MIRALASSESNEWYTPDDPYLNMVRELFGGQIDLDPASCAAANKIVKAKQIYTVKDDALQLPWIAQNVFMNPPYGRGEQAASRAGEFCHYMLKEHRMGSFPEGVILVNSCTGAKWFQPLFDESICFVDHRIHYDVPLGVQKKSQPTKDNVFVYVGDRFSEFENIFKHIGRIRIASKHAKKFFVQQDSYFL